MALQPLRNPLLRFDALPTAMSLRKNPDNSVVWNADQQYYVGDVVISPDDGGAYVLKGRGATTAEAITTLLDITDPAEDAVTATPSWVALGPTGVGWSNYDATNPVATTPIVGGAVVFTAGNTAVTAAGLWVSVLKFNLGGAAVADGTNYATVTCTPNGTGAASSSVNVGVAASTGGNTLSVVNTWLVPADGTATTLTMATTGAAWTTAALTNLSWVVYRIF